MDETTSLSFDKVVWRDVVSKVPTKPVPQNSQLAFTVDPVHPCNLNILCVCVSKGFHWGVLSLH